MHIDVYLHAIFMPQAFTYTYALNKSRENLIGNFCRISHPALEIGGQSKPKLPPTSQIAK
jgi:hypothetical protein